MTRRMQEVEYPEAFISQSDSDWEIVEKEEEVEMVEEEGFLKV